MIEVIAGTNRPGANTLKIATLLQGMYTALGRDARVLSLAEMPSEIYNPASYAQKPASFLPLADRVLAAKGLHVVIPEYNGSFPGVMKYFIDMLKFPESFEHRCVAFTGVAAGTWGGLRAVEQLQMIFGYRNAYIMPERVWIPGINQKWNAEGTALTDENLALRLQDQAAQFAKFVDQHMLTGGSPD